MKNIWFFGDSFTFGTGCNPGDEYYELSPNEVKKKWTNIVSSELGGKEKIEALPGCSLDFIIDSLILSLDKISKGDILILSATMIERIDVYAQWYKNDQTLTDEFRKEIISKPIMYELLERDDYKNIIDLNRKINILEYSKLNRFPYLEEIKRDFDKKINTISSFLNKNGYEFFYWNHSDVFDFKTIIDETDGKIKDYHFTWQSHEDFATHFLKKYVKLPKYIL